MIQREDEAYEDQQRALSLLSEKMLRLELEISPLGSHDNKDGCF